MDAKELRIGNYVYFPFTKEVVKILGINAHEINGKIENSISFMNGLNLYCEKLEKLKAIELTDEFLEKLGFKNVFDNEFNTSFSFNNVEYHIPKHQLNTNFVFFKRLSFKTKNVHELQNLYFALTGEELVVSDAVS